MDSGEASSFPESMSFPGENVMKYDSEFDGELLELDDLSTFSQHETLEEKIKRGIAQAEEVMVFHKKMKSLAPQSVVNSYATSKPVASVEGIQSLPSVFLSGINSADINIISEMILKYFATNCQFHIRHNDGTYQLEGTTSLIKYWYGAMNLTPDAIFKRREAKFLLPRKDKVEFAYSATVTKIYVTNVFQELINDVMKEEKEYKNSSNISSNSNSSSSSSSSKDLLNLDEIVKRMDKLQCGLVPLSTPIYLSFCGTMTMYTTDEDNRISLLEMDTESTAVSSTPTTASI